MSDVHNYKREECSYFNSSHAYADGYLRPSCTCGWTGLPVRGELAATTLFAAHVQQALKEETCTK